MTRGRTGPEQIARQKIDAALAQAGWTVKNRSAMNLLETCRGLTDVFGRALSERQLMFTTKNAAKSLSSLYLAAL